MFIYSIRASTVKLIAVLVLCIVGLGILIGVSGDGAVYAAASGVEIDYGGIRTDADRIDFIKQFGLSVKEEPLVEDTVALPDSFDRALNEYNELQKLQGLDLLKYRNKRVTHCAYEVTNYDHPSRVTVNLYICRGRIIGCDLTAEGADGYVIPLTRIDSGKIRSDA